jgi:hypothetical protein
MRKLAVALLVSVLLVALGAGSAGAWGRGGYRGGHRGGGYSCYGCGWAGFAVGLGFGTLLTAPFWYPRAYPYPAYVSAYPAYPAPPYAYPPYGYPSYPYPAYSAPVVGQTEIQGVPGTAAPPPLPPAASRGGEAESSEPATGTCHPVTVEGHYETRVLPGGQRETVWVPAYRAQICP